MAASSWNPNNPRVVSPHGVPQIIYGCLEANSETFKAGTPVYLTSGTVTICTDGGAACTGIAMKDATNVTSGNIEIPIQVIHSDDLILMRVTNNGTDALASTLAPGAGYGFYVDSDSVFYADANDTSNDVVTFIEEQLDSTGASTYWGWFKLLDGVTGSLNL